MRLNELDGHRKTIKFAWMRGFPCVLALAFALGACGPIEIDAPIYANVKVDRDKKLTELDQAEEEDICKEVETTKVSCNTGANQVTYEYSSQSCYDDLASVPDGCGANVNDYLACLALDACGRTSAECEALSSCAPELNIYIDIDVEVTVNVQQPLAELDDEEIGAVCQDVETIDVTCEKGSKTVDFSYSSTTCTGDLSAVESSCGANVGDYLACLALDACDRKSAPECSKLLECDPTLQIFIDVVVVVNDDDELDTLDEEQTAEACASVQDNQVTCELGGATVTFDYSAQACVDDIGSLTEACGATVADLNACLAVDACDRANAEECLNLLQCGSLEIFGSAAIEK